MKKFDISFDTGICDNFWYWELDLSLRGATDQAVIHMLRHQEIKFEIREGKIMQEFKFEITIDGVDGKLYYSIDAESEQEAKEMVSYFLQSQPFQIELTTKG